jgi:hypothetical protein
MPPFSGLKSKPDIEIGSDTRSRRGPRLIIRVRRTDKEPEALKRGSLSPRVSTLEKSNNSRSVLQIVLLREI